MQPKVKVLDLSKETALCGDITVHILEEMEKLSPGDKLIVKTLLDEEILEESIRSLEITGVARLVEKKKNNEIIELVFEKQAKTV
ncbi:MAG: hypothetical protein ABWW69_02340 [Pyrodictiaceae archaeon]